MKKPSHCVSLINGLLKDAAFTTNQKGSHLVLHQTTGSAPITIVIPHGKSDGVHSSVASQLITQLTAMMSQQDVQRQQLPPTDIKD